MKGRSLSTAVIAAASAVYAAVSLWPYEWQWQIRGWIVNAAEPLPEGGVRFRKPGIAFTKAAPAWVATAMRSHELELWLRVRSLEPEQSGPARILTLSLDPYQRNFMIGQEGADLVLRLRTAWTDANGTIDGRPVARVPRVFLTDHWVDLRTLIEPGSLRITVGEELLVEEALPLRPLESWDPSYRLALGNELTGQRPWLGEIRRAIVRTGESKENYADPSELELPSFGMFGMREGHPKLVPLRDLGTRDAVENVALYVPLGLLLGFLLGGWSGRPRRRLVCGALIFIAAVSTSMEVLQVFVPRRAPSIDDVIFNILGGSFGYLLGIWVQGRLGAVIRRWALGGCPDKNEAQRANQRDFNPF